MTLCKHISLLINRDDIQELVGEYKRRIGKLIFDSYQALVEAVKAWNHEEKRLELVVGALRNLLIACRFSAFFLAVSIKKRTFAEKFNVLNYRLWQH